MLADDADGLVAVFRTEVDDATPDASSGQYGTLWKDDEIYRYLTEACDRLARDTEGLYEVSSIGFHAGDVTVLWPLHLLKIRYARLVSCNQPLDVANTNSQRVAFRDYGYVVPLAMFNSTGRPQELVRDYDANAIRFVPTPNADDTLELQSYVTISEAIKEGDPLPFSDAVDQRLLLEFMKSKAYRKQDAETQDLQRAKDAEALYKDGALERKLELQRNRRAAGTVRMEGW